MRSMRNAAGEPSARTRALAALLLIGLVVLTAPIVLIPVLGALLRTVF